MCEKCYSYIYDCILAPLPINHVLRGYIDNKSLKTCLHEVAECISRVLKECVNNRKLIDCLNLFGETYEVNQEVLSTIVPKEYKEQKYDERMWNKFKEVNQDNFKDLNHAIDICMDNMVVKKNQSKEQILEHFFMHKLRHLLFVLPDIHKEHTEKRGVYNGKSLGSVPQDKINYIRRMAGLPVKDEVYISIDTIYDLYD